MARGGSGVSLLAQIYLVSVLGHVFYSPVMRFRPVFIQTDQQARL